MWAWYLGITIHGNWTSGLRRCSGDNDDVEVNGGARISGRSCSPPVVKLTYCHVKYTASQVYVDLHVSYMLSMYIRVSGIKFNHLLVLLSIII